MENFFDKIEVVVEIDNSISEIKIASQIASAFAQIERNDLRVAEVRCNPQTKDLIIRKVGDKFGDTEKWLWGASYNLDTSIPFGQVILTSEHCPVVIPLK